MNEYFAREYAYSKIGVPIYGEISGRKYERTNIVAGYFKSELTGKMLYKENMTAELFEDWFENILLPGVPRKSYIIMDNAPFHRKKVIHAIGRKRKCRVIFLPAYSPDLNNIEQQWAIRKRRLRKNMQHHPTFLNALLFNL